MMKSRRGACPGLSAPMPTGDGLLVRLMPVAPVCLDAMAGFCDAARRHGNGIVEITARGSLQVRGLAPGSAPPFASAVRDLGIAVQDGVPVIAAIDDGAADLLARQLRRAIADARLLLSPKLSVVVDGGGPLHLDELSADVRLRVVGFGQGPHSSVPRFHVGLGGDAAAAVWLGTVTADDAVRAVLHILAIIAAHGPAARAADVLCRDGVEAFRAVVAMPSAIPPSRVPAEMIGLHAMGGGGMALGVGLVFGHTHADALAELVRAAARHGAHAARPVPGRALLLTGVSALNARDLTVAAERLGFVVHAGDLRRRIVACPGAPACGSGLIPARALASALAPVLAPVAGLEHERIAVHISGCAKGCAHQGAAALTLVGTPRGCGIIRHGSAHAAPHCYVDPARIGDALSKPANLVEPAHGRALPA